MAEAKELAALIAGDKAAWDGFVRRYAGLILSAVRGLLREGTEAEDLLQEVLVRLCKDNFRLLKTYDPARAGLTTWLTIVARSTARDVQRRHRPPQSALEDVPETLLAVTDVHHEPLKLPKDLLSPRQQLVLTLLYEKDMDVADVAKSLGVDPQTVRSTHHKAMLKLRAHFAAEGG
ncbi:MAG TPA: sigma-70 family RNA polymerase sigma factor [Stellaceae bacterium]|nr:sigma-70 family RNA polymerase sigma factor [Stellaceae bacterium]